MVKVTNTSKKRVEATIAGVVHRVKATPLSKDEAKEAGRQYAQGVTPDADGMIEETYTHRLVVGAGQTVDVPDEAWAKFNANNAADTFGLVAEGK